LPALSDPLTQRFRYTRYRNKKGIEFMRTLCSLLFFTFLLSLSSTLAQNQSCPARNGIFAFANDGWIELKPVLAKKVKQRAAFPAHNKVIAEYPGYTSSSVLPNNVSICGTGIPVGTTFRLARAKQDDKNRQVTIGTMNPFSSSFSFDIDRKQEVELQQTIESNGTYLLLASRLAEGQYILFMQQSSSLSSTPAAFDFVVQAKIGR
jgi:hypothetical protein